MDVHHHKPNARSNDPIERRLADWMYRQNKLLRAGTESFYRHQRLKQIRPPGPPTPATEANDFLLDDERLGIVKRRKNRWTIYFASNYDKQVPIFIGYIITTGPEPSGPCRLIMFHMYRVHQPPLCTDYETFDEAIDQAIVWSLVTSSPIVASARLINLGDHIGLPREQKLLYDREIESKEDHTMWE